MSPPNSGREKTATMAEGRNNPHSGNLLRKSQSCDRRKRYETYRYNWRRAVRVNAGADCVRLGAVGHGSAGHAGRHDHSGQGRSRTRSRPYGPRRARPPLRLGPWSRTSLRLAPSSLNSSFQRNSRSPYHCPGEDEFLAVIGRACQRNRSIPRWSAQPHLDRDPYQIGMILGPELLLEQRGRVGDRLVGDVEGVGDFDDLVAAAEQSQDFQLARTHL